MTQRIELPNTDLSVYPLCLGGNVFGWTANDAESNAVLDHHHELGGNFIDTADVYSRWVPGHLGGESETVIGNWQTSRKARSSLVIATKVAKLDSRPGLSRANILAACDDSLRRLKTDYIDLYYAHEDDQLTPLEETLGAFDELVKSGKVRYIAASNYTGQRLREAIEISEKYGFAKYVALQNQYNLLDRSEFETDSAPVLEELGLSAIPFYGLAVGFLTGKYQPGVVIDSPRAAGAERYQNDRGWAAVAALGQIAAEMHTTQAAVALAWLREQPTVSAPIASARSVEQLGQIMPVVQLSDDQLALLSETTNTPNS